MIYAVEASSLSAAGASPPTSGAAVHFSGLSGANGKCGIQLPSLSCTNNGYLGWSGWFKTTNWFPGGMWPPYAWMVDSTGDYIPYFFQNGDTQWDWNIGNGTYSIAPTIGASDSLTYLINDTWIHIMGACDVNQTSGNKKFKIYVGDTDTTANYSESNPAWTLVMNGKDFWLGDDGYGDSWEGDVADFSFWPGVNLLTAGDISEATRRLFIDGSGNRVDPSIAIAALGTPALMLTGGVTGFLANALGGSGGLSVPAGYDYPSAAADSPP